MIRKISQGVGQALVPLIIAFAIPGIDLSDAGTWTAERVVEIKNLSVTMPLVGMVLILLAMHFVYPLSKKKIEEVQVALGRTE